MAGSPKKRARRKSTEAASTKPNSTGQAAPRQRRKFVKDETPKTHDQRVERIVYLMIKDQWGRDTPFVLATEWDCSLKAITRAADQASVRIETATGELRRKVVQAECELDEIRRLAIKAGQFSAAVRAVDLKMRLHGALSTFRPGRGKHGEGREDERPRGLPPELAQLDPPPSIEEVEHFAETPNASACPHDGCRVHGKAPTRPDEVH